MILTIGYEAASPTDFLATLQAAGVKVVADIRDRAQSRRPGFSKTALSAALEAAGIRYVHFRELGDPAEGRQAARAGDRRKFIAVFSQVMNTPEAQNALTEIEALAAEQALCLLCYERNPQECHRTIVAEALESRGGGKVRHLGVRHFEQASKQS